MKKTKSLVLLIARLKACPSQDNSCSKKMLHEAWNCFRRIDLENGDELTPSLMAGLILFDEEQFGHLLTEAELSQMTALARLALERYNLKANPPNKLGKTIAASLKEST